MSNLATRLLFQTLAMPRKHTKRLKAAVMADRCIIPTCKSGKKPHARGLCMACYLKFRKRMFSKQTDDERLQFESNAVAQGLILPPGEMGTWRSEANDPFIAAG